MYVSLQLSQDKRGVAYLTLNRPQIRNAFDEIMISEIDNVFRQLKEDPSVRVIVLGAVGPCFCAGADIAWMHRAAQQDEATNLQDARQFAQMMATIADCTKPIIASVQGSAFGGGVGLICAADIAIADVSAQFAISEAKFGILPSVIGPYLIQAVGVRHALQLALRASRITAEQALTINLLHQVVQRDELESTVETIVSELLANGPRALTEIKLLFKQLVNAPIDEQTRELTARTISRVRASAEARLGFNAFIHKQVPQWHTLLEQDSALAKM